jgi:hypothetical protein
MTTISAFQVLSRRSSVRSAALLVGLLIALPGINADANRVKGQRPAPARGAKAPKKPPRWLQRARTELNPDFKRGNRTVRADRKAARAVLRGVMARDRSGELKREYKAVRRAELKRALPVATITSSAFTLALVGTGALRSATTFGTWMATGLLTTALSNVRNRALKAVSTRAHASSRLLDSETTILRRSGYLDPGPE